MKSGRNKCCLRRISLAATERRKEGLLACFISVLRENRVRVVMRIITQSISKQAVLGKIKRLSVSVLAVHRILELD